MKTDRRMFLGGLGLALMPGALLRGAAAYAVTPDGGLVIGMASETSSIDPHWHIVTANSSVSQHIFDRLVHMDEHQGVVPGLAESWKAIDDTTWEFTLRAGASFHDGAPVTVEDLIFTYERAQNVQGAIFNLRAYLGDKTFEKVDERRLRVITKSANPIVPNELTAVAIISKAHGEGASSEDYNSGKATIGSGPYRFVSYTPGQSIVLARNDAYWGPKPAWAKVEIRPIANGGSRVAALQSGDVALIDSVPPADMAHLAGVSGIKTTKATANRMVFLFFDHNRETTPYAKANDGSEIPNPFRDLRVRQAFNLALDKAAIANRILSDAGEAASQLVPEGIFGFNPEVSVTKADAAKAKALLAEAGFPEGFTVTLHGPNDRFIRDSAVLQATAQMLARIGVKVEVDAMPSNIFYKRASSGGPDGVPEFSFFLVGYGAATGESSGPLRNLIHSYDKSKGYGSNNRGRYSNREIDALIEKGMATVDDTARKAIFEECAGRAIADVALVPLYYPISVWAESDTLAFAGRSDERTLAMDVQPAG